MEGTAGTFGEAVDTYDVERAARDFNEIVAHSGFGAVDVYPELMQSINSLATRALGRLMVGVDAGIYIGCMSEQDVQGTVMNSQTAPFIGQFNQVTTILAPKGPFLLPECTYQDSFVPALVFDPFHDIPEEFDGPYRDIPITFRHVAIPLVGVPFNIERMPFLSN